MNPNIHINGPLVFPPIVSYFCCHGTEIDMLPLLHESEFKQRPEAVVVILLDLVVSLLHSRGGPLRGEDGADRHHGELLLHALGELLKQHRYIQNMRT